MDNAELERLFDQKGIPRRFLYPLVYRLMRGIGIRVKPPLRMKFWEQFLYIGPLTFLCTWTALYLILDNPGPKILATISTYLTCQNTLLVWSRCRRIRSRLGVEPQKSATATRPH